jgi:ribosome biogenesis GTPase
MTAQLGLIVAAHGRHYLAQSEGQKWLCVTRGKKRDVATGDRVSFVPTSADQGVIEEILPRTTFLYRSDQYRSKLLAANLTQLMIVVATEPSFSDDPVSRALIAAEAAGISAHLLLNKIDISAPLDAARARLANYAKLGYPVHEMSAVTDPTHTLAILQPLLKNQSTILIGQSGMGKSTLINRIYGERIQPTLPVRESDSKGRHTTSTRELILLPQGGLIIDTPGLREFHLWLADVGLDDTFPDLAEIASRCRFRDCRHHSEGGCAVQQAVPVGVGHARVEAVGPLLPVDQPVGVGVPRQRVGPQIALLAVQ